MNLQESYGRRFRVTLDLSFQAEKETGKTAELWRYHEIVGRYGTVYLYGAD